MASVSSAYKQLINAHLWRQFFKRLLGVADGKRDQNCPRPGRNLVDVEPEPCRERHDLRRNGRYGIPVILAQETKVELGERVALGHASEFQYLFARTFERGLVGRMAHYL